MSRVQRGAAKLKKKPARVSTARVRRSAPSSPMIVPVLTPRPDLNVPSVSLENVDWEDGREPLSPLMRWEHAERQLENKLAGLGVVGRSTRFDLKDGRLVWVDDAQLPVADARAQVLATWMRGSNRLLMAWADPVLASAAIPRLEEMGDSLEVDLATARELVLAAAEGAGAEFVLALEAEHAEHYLALRGLRPSPGGALVTPGSPVGMVLRGLADLRRAVSQRDEPTDVLRARFLSLGKTILAQAEGSYKESEWLGRLQRAGRVVTQLAGRLVPPTFTAIAAGRPADEWLVQSVAIDLADAIKLLEDEWSAFA